MQQLKPLLGHMGVDGGGGDVCMPQEHLDRPQVRSVIEQMGGKGVPQGVWGDGGLDLRHQCIAFNE